jgi:hypothetical protein
MKPYYQSHRVRSVAVCPFFFDTPLVQSTLKQQLGDRQSQLLSRLPFITVDEVVDACFMVIDRNDLSSACISVSPKSMWGIRVVDMKGRESKL